jgi:RNA polymerase sigma factor (sigma-70 family)
LARIRGESRARIRLRFQAPLPVVPRRPHQNMVRVILPYVKESEPFRTTLQRAKQGDPAALDALSRRFYPAVERLVHHRLATDLRQGRPWLSARFSTADVVQDVFEGVLRDLGTFLGESEEAFTGYLLVVVRNRIVDAVRFHEAAQRDGRRMHALGDDYDGESRERDPASSVMASEGLDRLHAALAGFDAREQHLLRARLDGLASFKELAAQLGYGSDSAARRAYYDAQARLALRLKDGD